MPWWILFGNTVRIQVLTSGKSWRCPFCSPIAVIYSNGCRGEAIMLSTVQSSRNWSAARLRFPELVHLHRPDTAQHLVQFYDDDTFVIKTASHLVAQALVEASSVVIIATEFHLRQITAELATFRLDIEAIARLATT
jgi:hypothetical protein